MTFADDFAVMTEAQLEAAYPVLHKDDQYAMLRIVVQRYKGLSAEAREASFAALSPTVRAAARAQFEASYGA